MADHKDSVLILYNLPRANDGALPGGDALPCPESDAGVLEEVEAVAEALAALGVPFRRASIRRLSDLADELAVAPETVVFNLVESLAGPAQDFNLVPAVCSAFGKASTGSDTPCLVQCLDKWQTKAALSAFGVPTPKAVVVREADRPPRRLPPAPLIIKPLLTEASEGIGPESVFPEAGPPLWDAVARLQRLFGSPVLIEHFVDGREVNVSLIEQAGEVVVLPLAEIEFVNFPPGQPRIVDYRAKWLVDSPEYRNTVRRIPTPLPEAVANRIRRYARLAWQAVGCSDYARVDFRLDERLRPYVLEVNANPDISPVAGFAAALAAAGIPFATFVQTVIGNASARLRPPSTSTVGTALQGCPLPMAGRAPASDRAEALSLQPAARAPVSIRPSHPEDREAILAILVQTGAFRPREIAVAREVLDAALAEGPQGQYRSYTAVVGEQPVGWACIGPTPCTAGTFDLYWLAVDPTSQGRGIGKALTARAEREAAALGARLLVVETSGREGYDSATFYRKVGYEEQACLKDFYAPGDDKLVFIKRLGQERGTTS